MKERIFIKDNYDGQEYCISGDKHFFLIDVTDMYTRNVEVKIDGILEWQRNTRREIIRLLDKAFTQGKIKQRDRDMMYFRWIDWNSLENCAKKYGVTRERVRQIEAKVLEILRYSDE